MSDLFSGKTLPEMFYNKVKKTPSTELFFTKRDGKWTSITYNDAFTFVRQSIAGFQALNFQPQEKMAIFAENREEWILTEYAAHWLRGTTAAIYTTSSPEQIAYILNESEAKILFVSNEEMLKRMEGVGALKYLKTIVMWDAPAGGKISTTKIPSDVQLLFKENFLKAPIAEDEAKRLLTRVLPEDLCILLYTSGTTGEPKGVMLTHLNLTSDLHSMADAVPELQPDLVTISFLPLSHIYERALENLLLFAGLRIYFAESVDKLIENIAEVRPQVMVAVPRIFEKMYAKIMDRIKNSPPFRKKIFAIALEIGKKTFSYRYRHKTIPFYLYPLHWFADLLVFKNIRAITGGRAKLFISGGAPLSQEIAEFFFTAGFTILEGYGLSETCILCCNRVTHFKFGTVGPKFSNVEMKIASDGEILVRGPTVMKGYFKRPDATAEAITPDGWFQTGDIGEFDADGFLKITDRKKDLIVTAGGKKVAPQPIENALKADALIESVCLLGDNRKYIVALIVPNLDLCRSWGAIRDLNFQALNDCATNAALREHFQKEVEKVNATLPHYSTIKDFRVLPALFSIESGELTPTLKLKRRVIQTKYSTLIDSMYPSEPRRQII